MLANLVHFRRTTSAQVPAGTRKRQETKRLEERVRKETRKGGQPWRFFRQQRGVLLATVPFSIKLCWRRPLVGGILFGVKDKRSISQRIKMSLQTIHPNPGPGRNKTEEGKTERRERRKRRERRERRRRGRRRR